MQRRADGPRIELVNVGSELPGPSLSAHGSDVATRIFGCLPSWVLEVNGHRITVTISGRGPSPGASGAPTALGPVPGSTGGGPRAIPHPAPDARRPEPPLVATHRCRRDRRPRGPPPRHPPPRRPRPRP